MGGTSITCALRFAESRMPLAVAALWMMMLFPPLLVASDGIVAPPPTPNVSMTVCNGTTANMGIANSSSRISGGGGGGTLLSVPMQSGVTYLLVDCVVPLLQVAFTNSTASLLLENVTIVSRGGSVLPAVLVNATTVRNLFVDISGVRTPPSMNREAPRPVVALRQVSFATNIAITMTHVFIENAMDMTVVRIDLSGELDGLTVTLVNCTMKNVTTSGLVEVIGNMKTTTVTALNVTLSGGQYLLTLLPEGSYLVVFVHVVKSLSNVAIASRDGVFMDVNNAPNGAGVFMTMFARVQEAEIVTDMHVVIDEMTVRVSLHDPAGTDLSIIKADFVTSFTNSSFVVSDSEFLLKAGSAGCLSFSFVLFFDGVSVQLLRTSMELVVGTATMLIKVVPTFAHAYSVIAAAVNVDVVGQLNRHSVIMTESNFTIYASNESTLQNYSSVTCSPILWQNVSNTMASTFVISQTTINITARETSVGLALNPSLPVIAILSLNVAAFLSIGGLFQNTTVVVQDVDFFSDIVVIPPLIPKVESTPSLAVQPLRATIVTIAVVFSNSNWTNCSISVNRSRIIVQQLQFLVSPQEDVVSWSGGIPQCNSIVLVNTTALVSFQNPGKLVEDCVPPFIKYFFSLVVSQQATLNVTNATLSTESCSLDVKTKGWAKPAPGTSLWPLFVAGIYLPPVFSSSRVSLLNISAIGLPSMRTGPAIALSGATAVRLDARVTKVSGFPSGVVWSTPGAASTLQSSRIHAIEVDAEEGALLAGNVSVATLFTATLRSCTLGGRFFFGADASRAAACGSATSSPSAFLPSSSAVVDIVLQGCNVWNNRPLTLAVSRSLMNASQCASATAAGRVGAVTTIRGEDYSSCAATATLEPVVPLVVARVSTATVVVAMSALVMSAVGAASVASITSSVRMQTALGALRVGRRCALLLGDGASDSTDDVGSSPFDNPLQLSLPVPDSHLTFAAGCVLGNSLLFIVAVVALNLPFDAQLSRTSWVRSSSPWRTLMTTVYRHVVGAAPGNAVVVLLLLLPPTVVSSQALATVWATASVSRAAHVATAVSGAVCVLVFAVGPIVSVGLMLWAFPLRAAAVVAARKPVSEPVSAIATTIEAVAAWLFREPSKWVSVALSLLSSSPPKVNAFAFRRRFGVVFDGYRGGCHWYAAVDVAVAVVSSVLGGLPPSVDSSSSLAATCSWVPYAMLAVAVVACLGAVAFRSCMTPWDNLWSIVSNGLSIAAVVAQVVAGSSGTELANSVTAALAWISLVPAATAIVRLIAGVCLRERGPSQSGELTSDGMTRKKGKQRRRGDVFAASVSSTSSLLDTLPSQLASRLDTRTPSDSLALLVRFICTNSLNRNECSVEA